MNYKTSRIIFMLFSGFVMGCKAFGPPGASLEPLLFWDGVLLAVMLTDAIRESGKDQSTKEESNEN